MGTKISIVENFSFCFVVFVEKTDKIGLLEKNKVKFGNNTLD